MEKIGVGPSNVVSPRIQNHDKRDPSPDVTQGTFANKTLMLQTDASHHEYFEKSNINLPKININTRSKEQ